MLIPLDSPTKGCRDRASRLSSYFQTFIFSIYSSRRMESAGRIMLRVSMTKLEVLLNVRSKLSVHQWKLHRNFQFRLIVIPSESSHVRRPQRHLPTVLICERSVLGWGGHSMNFVTPCSRTSFPFLLFRCRLVSIVRQLQRRKCSNSDSSSTEPR
jgi:hypothetical protein